MADNWDIGYTTLVKYHVKTKGSLINTKPRRHPIHLKEKILKTIKNLYDNEIIRKCGSPWNTLMVCV